MLVRWEAGEFNSCDVCYLPEIIVVSSLAPASVGMYVYIYACIFIHRETQRTFPVGFVLRGSDLAPCWLRHGKCGTVVVLSPVS